MFYQASEMVFGCSMMTTLLLSRVVDLRDTDMDVARVEMELRLNWAKFDELSVPGAQRPFRHHGNVIQRKADRVRHNCVENRKYMIGLAAEFSGAKLCMNVAMAILVWVRSMRSNTCSRSNMM